MIGVIVLPGQDNASNGLGEHSPLPMLPLGDRPILQHMLEFLAHQGIREFEIILDHAPEQVEQYFGDGTRWGCRFCYHLVSQTGFPYRHLSVISGIERESWLLAHADELPYVSFSDHFGEARPVAFLDSATGAWSGAALFPPGKVDEAILRASRTDLNAYFEAMAAHGRAGCVDVSQTISVKTPAALLRTQRNLLDRTFSDLMIGGNENERGVWMSRNVVIHPSARLHPPVYLGPNSRLGAGAQAGPYAVISGNCIIDEHTIVEDSLIISGSYVGKHLEVRDSIVSRNLLVNARLDTGIAIPESFLLGNLNGSPHRNWLAQTLEAGAAILLIALFSPLLLFSLIYGAVFRSGKLTSAEVVELPALADPQTWRTYRLPFLSAVPWPERLNGGWKSFLLRFLPGLFAVARGKLSLVGLPPRTRDEVMQLSKDWQAFYLTGKAGLITEATLFADGLGGGADAFLTEACYGATRGWAHDLNLFTQYFLGLLVRPHFEAAVEPHLPAE
jgi:NDP-sugar pyrophosphorylase family protein